MTIAALGAGTTAIEEAERVVAAASLLCGDVEKARRWFFNEPIADYEQKTAAQLVRDGHDEAVVRYLRDLENGACG